MKNNDALRVLEVQKTMTSLLHREIKNNSNNINKDDTVDYLIKNLEELKKHI